MWMKIIIIPKKTKKPNLAEGKQLYPLPAIHKKFSARASSFSLSLPNREMSEKAKMKRGKKIDGRNRVLTKPAKME